MCDPVMYPEIHCPDQDGWGCPDDDQNTVTSGLDALGEWEKIGGSTWYPNAHPSTAGSFNCKIDLDNDRIKWDGSWVDVTVDASKAELTALDGRKWKIQHSATAGGFLAGSTVQVKYWDGTAAHSRLLG